MSRCPECGSEFVEGIEKCADCGCDLTENKPETTISKLKMPWSFKRSKGVSDTPEWPKDECGENVSAAFLTNIGGFQIDYDMALSVLRAYGIPYACDFPGMGQVSKLYTGFSSGGMNIYVPETMLDEAKNILFADSEELK